MTNKAYSPNNPSSHCEDQASSNTENKAPSSQKYTWTNATDFLSAAMHAYGYGLAPIPIIQGTKETAVEQDQWLQNLNTPKVCDYWKEHPEHELGCILDGQLIVLCANTPESIQRLKTIEKEFGLTPEVIIQTPEGQLHFFRCAQGTVAKSDAHSSEKFPSKIDIKTAGDLIMLPPSSGNKFLVFNAKNRKELSEISQEAIDAVYRHNGSLAITDVESDCPNLLSSTDPDVGHDDTDVADAGQSLTKVKSPPQARINPQVLDRMLFPNPPLPESKRLPTTTDNIKHLLEKHKISVRYNAINKKTEIIIPGHTGTLDNQENVAMTNIVSLAELNRMKTSLIPQYIEALADPNAYHPGAEWIESKPWDGIDRLTEFYATLTAQEDFPEELKNILMKKWLLSVVAAALKAENFRTRGVLTLQGPQGIGKTSWVLSLINDEQLRSMAIKIDHHLDISNKDSILGAITHWIVEIGELDSSFKKDLARLKGFLTNIKDKVRRPYAARESEYPRKTVFVATVNKHDFLVDDTGNSRWWTIPVVQINYNHDIDMQQLFAQLAVDLKNGAEWWLTPEEEQILESCNEEHQATSSIRELVLDGIDFENEKNTEPMSASEVLKRLGVEHPTNPQCRECGAVLREKLGNPKKIKGIFRFRISIKPREFDI